MHTKKYISPSILNYHRENAAKFRESILAKQKFENLKITTLLMYLDLDGSVITI